jgi:hypothetical protein
MQSHHSMAFSTREKLSLNIEQSKLAELSISVGIDQSISRSTRVLYCMVWNFMEGEGKLENQIELNMRQREHWSCHARYSTKASGKRFTHSQDLTASIISIVFKLDVTSHHHGQLPGQGDHQLNSSSAVLRQLSCSQNKCPSCLLDASYPPSGLPHLAKLCVQMLNYNPTIRVAVRLYLRREPDCRGMHHEMLLSYVEPIPT